MKVYTPPNFAQDAKNAYLAMIDPADWRMVETLFLQAARGQYKPTLVIAAVVREVRHRQCEAQDAATLAQLTMIWSTLATPQAFDFAAACINAQAPTFEADYRGAA